jgi:GNAT superfamily N-acetyltransferase
MSLESSSLPQSINTDTPRIRAATLDDRAMIRRIAEEAWPVAFGSLISEEFLRHELAREYSDEALYTQMQEEGHCFLLLEPESGHGDTLGFASYSLRSADDEPLAATLHKLYLWPSLKGKGYGGLLLNAVVDAVRQAGAAWVELSVNRQNPAIQFYQRHGFSIVCERDLEVGPGFVRQDYLMTRPLSEVANL